MVNWETCIHSFVSFFGPVLKCRYCGASTMYSVDGHGKPILPPTTVDELSSDPSTLDPAAGRDDATR